MAAEDHLNYIGDVARLTVFHDLEKALIPLGYRVEFSRITVRIYKGSTLAGRIWLYPQDMHLRVMIGGKLLPYRLVFDDPKFFDKIVNIVISALSDI